MTELSILTSYALIGVVATAAFAPLLINILYKFNIVVQHRLMRNKMNEEFYKLHRHKSGTPTMGGLMIAIAVGVLTILLVPASDTRDVFLIGWGIFTLYGLVDESLVKARKIDEKFRLLQESFGWRVGKFGIWFLIATFCLGLVQSQLGLNELTIAWEIVLPITSLTLVIGGFGMVLALYGVEIVDGLDGMVTGKFLIALSVYAVVAALTGHEELLPMLGLTLGSALVYLYFNITPARIFMGSVGTLPIAFLLIFATLVTDTFLIFVVMGTMFWIELFSSLSQILAIRFFKKKIFKIAPLHHHFEAVGWSEAKVVQRFWLGAAFAGLVALWLLAGSGIY